MIFRKNAGSFKNFNHFYHVYKQLRQDFMLDHYGRQGVAALTAATPVDTGKTAASWYYNVRNTKNGIALEFINSNKTTSGTPIAILIQYGFLMPSGYYVQGRDFINPAIRPIFDTLADNVWRELTK